jgi:hypothetical protein
MALDIREREIAQLSAAAETGGNPLTADVRESKIVEIAKKNRTLTLALEREKAEKGRLQTQLKAAQAGGNQDSGKPKTESQVEAACREVVAEAAEAAEAAQKEAAEWREKAKEAVSRAERDGGRYANVKAENDRMRAIIKREVGEAAADFNRLEDSLAGAGGWRGRAQEISLLKDKVKELKLKLAAAVSAPAVDKSDQAPNSPLAKHDTKHRENLAAEAIKRRQGLENAEAQLADAKEEVEVLKRKANSAVARKAVVEKDLRGIREKMRVLTEKSAGDDKLIDALKAEIKKLFSGTSTGSSGGGSMRGSGGLPGMGTRGGGGGMDSGGGQNNFAGAAVPVAVYQAVERRAQAQEQQIQQQERVVQEMQQQTMQLRAKLSSTEYELSAAGGGGGGGGGGDFSAAGIAAAAAGLGGGGGGGGCLSDQNEDDVEALIAHTEGLERLTELLRGKLAASDKQVDELRDQLGIEHQQYVQLKARVESGSDGGGATSAGGGDGGGAGGDEEVRVLRAALLAQKDDLERVQKSCKAQLQGMEQEVELYREMVQEMRGAKS